VEFLIFRIEVAYYYIGTCFLFYCKNNSEVKFTIIIHMEFQTSEKLKESWKIIIEGHSIVAEAALVEFQWEVCK